MTWVVSIHRGAMAGLYAILRGEVAYVSEALRAMQVNPYHPDSELLGPDTYRITVRGHVIEYLVTSREVKILHIQ